MAQAHVGVSGWRYRSWRGDFYPTGLAQRRELEYVASRMSSAEVNGSFYSLLRPSTYRGFHDQTPAGFVLAVKGSRYLTHLKRLADAETALANFLASGVLALGEKLGPLLWQLPATFPYDETRLASFFELLPRTTSEAVKVAHRHDDKLSEERTYLGPVPDLPIRHALEPRHESFGEPAALRLLRDHDIALVVSDSPRRWPMFEERTSDFMYVRLHGHTKLYTSGYSARSLDEWARKTTDWLSGGLDVYVYFDNDARGRAPWDAVGLIDRLPRPGLPL